MKRLPLVTMIAAAVWLPTLAQAGAYIFASETTPNQRLHPRTFSGAGGALVPTRVCIDTQVNSAMAIAAEPAVLKVIATMNRFRALPSHTFATSPDTDVPAGMIDVETVLLHEFLHVHGLAHPNHADEAGLPGAQSEGTKSADGPNNVWNQDAGVDGLHGSSDDVRGDDINLHWYQQGVNNPGIAPAIVDNSTMARTLAGLPPGHLFAANADVQVMAALGFANSESAVQQGLRPDEVQRHLHTDDVTTLRFTRAGIDGVQGSSDDYRPSLRYVGRFNNPQGEGCQISVRFDDNAALATSSVGGFQISNAPPEHWAVFFSRIKFNKLVNWYYTPGPNTQVTIVSDLPDASVLLAPVTVAVTVTKAAGNPIVAEPSGVVEVRDGPRHDPLTAYCTINLVGTPGEVGSCVLTPLRSGAKTLTADYLGHAGFDGGSDEETHAASATLTFSDITHAPAPSAVGAPVHFAWTLAPPSDDPANAATGSVTVKEATDCASPALEPAHVCTATLPQQTCSISFVSSGSKGMQLCYSGDAASAPAASGVAHEVIAGRATTTTIVGNAPDPAASFAPITVSVSVGETPALGGHPAGNVLIRDGAIGDPLTAGCVATLTGTAAEIAECTFSPRRAGNKTLTASFAAQGPWAASSATVNQSVRSFVIARNQPNTSRVGQGVSVTINLDVAPYLGAPQPTGTVTVSNGNGDTCQILLPATECLWVGSSAGIHSLTASWPGDGNYAAMTTAAVSQNVVADTYPQLVSIPRGSNPDSNGGSSAQSIALSADGRFVAFSSDATQLVNGDSNNATDVFVRDLMTGAVRRVSTSALGVQGNGISDQPAISADGRFVAFQSLASNLVAGDGNNMRDVFVTDLSSGSIVRVTEPASGSQPTANFDMAPSLSADGRHVAFATFYSLLPKDVNGEADIYVKDLQTGEFDLVSSDSEDRIGDFRSSSAVISADGRHVAFVSFAFNLVPDLPVREFYLAIYVKDRQTRSMRMVSSDAAGTYGNQFSVWRPGISADGRYIAFMSFASNLVANDSNNDFDIFVKDMHTGAIERINNPPGGGQPFRRSEAPAMSADARYVVFRSEVQNLVPGDSNGFIDIFVRDRQTGSLTRHNLTPAGAETTDFGADLPAISADGRFISFISASGALVPGDSNGVTDVFVRDRQELTTVRASAVTSGARSDGVSDTAAITRDGRYVAFSSAATSLVDADTNGVRDVFVHDRMNATSSRISVDASGIPGNGASDASSISTDQLWVAFRSSANNLVADDSNGLADIFVKQRVSGVIARVSTASNGAQRSSGDIAGTTSISADGQRVTYSAGDGNLVDDDSNGFDDVFIKDRTSGETTLVSRDGNANGPLGNGHSVQGVLSEDGTRVAFASDANNLVGDDSNGVRDVYVKTRVSGVMQRASSNAAGVQGNGNSSEPALSSDGRFVAFISSATDLVPDDSNGNSDVFVKDLLDGSITRVNTDAAGAQGTGGNCNAPSLSSDGRHVGFICEQGNLVAGDSNGLADAFVKDRVTGAIVRLPVSAVGVQANAASAATAMALSDNGFAVFSSNANNLVVADDQNFSDVFVNRYNAVPLIATTTTITGDTPDPSQPGAPYVVSVTVTRSAGSNDVGGAVTVSDGVAFCAAPLSGSGASASGQCNLASATLGEKTLTASYGGDANHLGSNAATATHTVSLATVPDAPTIGTAVAGNASVTISFTPPGNDGGNAISLFLAHCGSFTTGGGDSPITVVGPPNGVPVTCTVQAINGVGAGAVSDPSNEVTPQAPTALQVTTSGTPSVAGDSVSFTASIAPGTAGGTVAFAADAVPINGCTSISLSAATAVCTTSFPSIGQRAISASYSGDAAHITSNGALAGGQEVISVPSAPVITTATALDQAARITFNTSTSDGGRSILDYTADCTPGVHANSAGNSPIDVGGLDNNVAYRCSVRARNVVGFSAPSDERSVIPGSSGNSADLAISKTNGSVFVNGSAFVDYTISVSNLGPAAVVGARVQDPIAPDFSGAAWTCNALGNAHCAANGSGALDLLVDLPVDGAVQFTFSALPIAGPESPISNTATVAVPVGMSDPSITNNSATDGPDIRGIFRDSFEQ